MKLYEKPVVELVDDVAEVVCADGSNNADNNNGGNNQNVTACRFGRTEANPGSDACQSCSKTNGARSDQGGTFRADFTGCVENKPVKES